VIVIIFLLLLRLQHLLLVQLLLQKLANINLGALFLSHGAPPKVYQQRRKVERGRGAV
jgi:hypothetical protein